MTLEQFNALSVEEVADLFDKHHRVPHTGEPFGWDNRCCLLPIAVAEISGQSVGDLARLYAKSSFDFYQLAIKALQRFEIILLGSAFDRGMRGHSEYLERDEQQRKWNRVGGYLRNQGKTNENNQDSDI
jgi:hypothetical protein